MAYSVFHFLCCLFLNFKRKVIVPHDFSQFYSWDPGIDRKISGMAAFESSGPLKQVLINSDNSVGIGWLNLTSGDFKAVKTQLRSKLKVSSHGISITKGNKNKPLRPLMLKSVASTLLRVLKQLVEQNAYPQRN